MNNKQAVAQAINPMRAAESSGMGNRDVSRRSMLPDASTQMALAKMQEEKAQQEQEALKYKSMRTRIQPSEVDGGIFSIRCRSLYHGSGDISG